MPEDLGKALRLLPSIEGRGAFDSVALSYDERLLRRKRLTTAGGDSFLVDLPETVSLQGGEGFELEDGRVIAVEAGEDELLEVKGGDLLRFAWHIGNRHAPCQIEADRLLIQRDSVMADMLRQLGAQVAEVSAPFTPEGGAYGLGRTLPHEHGHVHGHVHHHANHEHIEEEGEDERRGPTVIDEV